VRSRHCAGLFCGDPAPWLPQAAKSGALGVGILPHPCSLNREKPLDALPCREAATRRALCSGGPAFDPCFSSARGCSRVSRPAAPLRAAATTSPWRCPAHRHSMSRRALRLVFLEAGLRTVGLYFVQERSCGHPTSCAPQRLGPGTPRRFACAAAVAPPFSDAARYAWCHPVNGRWSRAVGERPHAQGETVKDRMATREGGE
jgi:hypothetical protein